MQLSVRKARIALSPVPRQIISTTSPAHPLRAFGSSPLRSTLAHPRLHGQFSALLHQSISIWKGGQERGSHTSSNDADTRDPNAKVLRPVGDTNAAFSEEVHQKLMDAFIARVDELEPDPAPYSLPWLLRSFYEAKPKRCITLVVPSNVSRDAAREALQKQCKRWDGYVGALRSSYVCIVVLKSTFDALRDNLQYNTRLGFRGEARVYCAVGSKHEMNPISASRKFKTHIEASKDDKGEEHRLLLHSNGKLHESIEVDDSTVKVQTIAKENTAASSNINDLDSYSESLAWFLKRFACCAIVIVGGTAGLTYFATKATCGCNELCSGSEYEQEQHHGESYNKGKSKVKSALGVQHGAIQATGHVDASTHIHHGCDANPLSSSSPTIGNNQPNGNEGLTQKQ
jgi:hypothetical protein